MQTINLEKELQDLSIRRKKEDDLFLSDSPQAHEYFLHKNDDNSEMLKHFGTEKIVKDIDTRLRNIIEMKEKFGDATTKMYTSQDINNLCVKYRLRFLPSVYFTGNIGSEVLAKMKAFEDSDLYRLKIKEGKPYSPSSSDVLVRTYSNIDHGSYYIVAPAESFKLSDKPKDPLLFSYAGNGMWYLVCKWGNDLSITRRVRGWLSENYVYIHISMILLLALTVGIMVASTNVEKGIGVACGIGTLVITGMISAMSASAFPDRSKDIWNTEFK